MYSYHITKPSIGINKRRRIFCILTHHSIFASLGIYYIIKWQSVCFELKKRVLSLCIYIHCEWPLKNSSYMSHGSSLSFQYGNSLYIIFCRDILLGIPRLTSQNFTYCDEGNKAINQRVIYDNKKGCLI